jgi:hypothetical protein
MLRDIEADSFFARGRSHRRYERYNFQNYEGADGAIRDRRRDRRDLYDDLLRVSEQRTVRRSIPALLGQNSREQRTYDSTDTVGGNDVE